MSSVDPSEVCWTYENPSEWSKYFPAASGFAQSPININTADTIPEFYPPFRFSPKYESDQVFTLTNTGHQITATVDEHDDLWFTGGGLTGKYHFVNFHLHWGANDRHGSEHEIDEHAFPAEAHFVHKNDESGQVAVLGFIFTIAKNDQHGPWEDFADAAGRLVKMHESITCAFNLHQLMRVDEPQFFRYVGSLTTPPCTEGVIWTIFSQDIPIRRESLKLLRRNLMCKVYRPVQPLNGRTIFRNYSSSHSI